MIDAGVQIAMIVSGATIASGIGAFASSFILARMNAALRLKERMADWARQDDVARRVEGVAIQAREAAALLLARTNTVAAVAAETAAQQSGELHHIKTLVNNEKTGMLQSNLAQTLATLALLQRFSPEDLLAIRSAEHAVSDLRLTLAERGIAEATIAKDAKDAKDANRT